VITGLWTAEPGKTLSHHGTHRRGHRARLGELRDNGLAGSPDEVSRTRVSARTHAGDIGLDMHRLSM